MRLAARGSSRSNARCTIKIASNCPRIAKLRSCNSRISVALGNKLLHRRYCQSTYGMAFRESSDDLRSGNPAPGNNSFISHFTVLMFCRPRLRKHPSLLQRPPITQVIHFIGRPSTKPLSAGLFCSSMHRAMTRRNYRQPLC